MNMTPDENSIPLRLNLFFMYVLFKYLVILEVAAFPKPQRERESSKRAKLMQISRSQGFQRTMRWTLPNSLPQFQMTKIKKPPNRPLYATVYCMHIYIF